jgi:AcrR family transcriptional regulator
MVSPAHGDRAERPAPTSPRRRILISATQVFSRQGFDRTAVEDVIKPAGISRRTFYDLFSGKDDVFQEAHKRALDLLGEYLTPPCAQEQT